MKQNSNNKFKKQSFNSNGPIQFTGRKVEVRGDDINYALRKFKKKIQEDGILQTVREKEFYIKPSERRKREKAAGRARHIKKSTV